VNSWYRRCCRVGITSHLRSTCAEWRGLEPLGLAHTLCALRGFLWYQAQGQSSVPACSMLRRLGDIPCSASSEQLACVSRSFLTVLSGRCGHSPGIIRRRWCRCMLSGYAPQRSCDCRVKPCTRCRCRALMSLFLCMFAQRVAENVLIEGCGLVDAQGVIELNCWICELVNLSQSYRCRSVCASRLLRGCCRPSLLSL